ncbi:MAG: hypothetical protein R3F11_11410 [Verrucomicrobiales bacterium]
MVNFQGGNASMGNGVLLLREMDSRTGMIDQLRRLLHHDRRRPELISTPW